jgi:hypothetical protein
MGTGGERIEVLARFERSGMTPFRFRWNSTAFRVDRVTGRWEDREGQFRRCHYGVVTDTGDFFELRFHQADFSWAVTQVGVEG